MNKRGRATDVGVVHGDHASYFEVSISEKQPWRRGFIPAANADGKEIGLILLNDSPAEDVAASRLMAPWEAAIQ
jgi:hypothetical protein